jgi:hypothetical protein
MDGYDVFNLIMYAYIWVLAHEAWEPFVYMYNRVVIALRDAA